MIYSEELDVRVASIFELKEQQNCHLCRLLIGIYEYELTGLFTDNEGEAEYYASRKDPRKVCCKLRPTRADLILKYYPCGMVDKIARQLLVELDPAVPAMFHIWNQDKADAKQEEVSHPGLGYKSLSLYRGWSIALDHGSAVSGRPLLNRSLQKNEKI